MLIWESFQIRLCSFSSIVGENHILIHTQAPLWWQIVKAAAVKRELTVWGAVNLVLGRTVKEF